MTGTVVTQVKAIAFEGDIERLTEGFIGREWIFEEIDRWLQQDDQRFFILTGEPGIGKSAIAAQLTQIRQDIAAYHFCIAGRSGTIEPNNVLLSLAAQLVEYFPDYAETLANIIKPLKLSVNVEITIQNIKDSTVRGVVINNLHTQNPQEALNIILRQALAALPTPPEQPRLILIDSLDEAVTFSDRDNLITLLAGLNDLPPWVRVLLTSRPEDRVLVEFEPLEPHRIEEMSEQNRSDVREYVEGQVEQPAFQEELSKAALVPQTLIDEITKLSSGNFLYTKLLLNDIEAGRQSLDDLSALPKSIDEIYLAFLRRFKPEEWRKQYQPILGTLTVAQEPVTEDELANFTEIKPRILRQDLGIIRQFLDVIENDEGDTAYAIFHQSLRDYLLNKKRNKYFWCDAQEQHDLIIDYYRDGKKSWDKVALEEIDRYGQRYLAQHLVKADRVEELHTLLGLEKDGKNAWFKVKDNEGETADFLVDIRLAWTKAEEEFERQPAKAIGLQCRYALITVSVNSLADNIPNELLLAIVEQSIKSKQAVWTPIQGLAYARQMPKPEQKVQSLVKLVPHLPNSMKKQVLQEALAAARTIRYSSARSAALRIIALNAHEDIREQALQDAMSIARAETSHQDRASLLTDLAPYLTEPLKSQVFQEALRAAIEIENFNDCGKKLMHLIPIVPEELLSEMFEVLQIIISKPHSDESMKSEILYQGGTHQSEFHLSLLLQALSKRLSEPQKQEVLQDALALAREVQHGWDFALLLNCLIPNLAMPEKLEVLDEAWMAVILTLPEPLRSELLDESLAAIPTIQDPRYQYQAALLTGLMYDFRNMDLSESESQEMLKKGLSAVLSIKDERFSLVMALPSIFFSTFVKQDFVEALRDLILSDEGLGAFTNVIGLSKIAPLMPEAQKQEILEIALSSARTIEVNPAILEIFAQRNSSAVIGESATYRARGLIRIIPHLPESQRESISKEVLENIQAIQHPTQKRETLVALTSCLPKLLIQDVLQITKNTKYNNYDFFQVLTFKQLALYLPDPLKSLALEEAFTAAMAIRDSSQCIRELIELTPELPEQLGNQAIQHALTLSRIINDHFYQAVLLAKLAQAHSLDDLVIRAFNAVQAINLNQGGTWLPVEAQIESLVSLAPYLPEPLIERSLNLVCTYRDVNRRAKAKIGIASQAQKPVKSRVLEDALAEVQFLSASERSDRLIELLPYLPDSRKEEAIEQALSWARESYSRLTWSLPELVKNLPETERREAFLEEALSLASMEQHPHGSVESLAKCIPYLPKSLLGKELIRMRQFEWKPDCVKGLTAMLPYLPEALKSEVLEEAVLIAQTLDREKYGDYQSAEALTYVIPHLSGTARDLIIQETLAHINALSESNRCRELLANLAVCLPEPLKSQIIKETLEIIAKSEHDYLRHNTIRTLAPHLSNDLLVEALKITRTTQGTHNHFSDDRKAAFDALIPRLIQASSISLESIWYETLRDLALFSRKEFFQDFQSLVPLVTALGTTEAVEQIFCAVQDVGRWYP